VPDKDRVGTVFYEVASVAEKWRSS
jgi:hypothetical protein